MKVKWSANALLLEYGGIAKRTCQPHFVAFAFVQAGWMPSGFV